MGRPMPLGTGLLGTLSAPGLDSGRSAVGQHEWHSVMFASDYPLLTHERCLGEVVNLEFRDAEKLQKYVAGNAEALFFS